MADCPEVVAEGFENLTEDDSAQPVPCRPVARTDAFSSSRGKWSWFKRMAHKSLEIEQSQGAYDLVMIGDSITHFWEGCAYWTAGRVVQEDLARRYSVLNLGYGGDSTQHVLWRLENGELDGYRAKFITLMVGTNNRQPAEEVAEGIRRILDVIAVKQPQAKVLLHPMIPRVREEHKALRAKNDRTNELIRSIADGKDVLWVDLRPIFEGAGVTPEKQRQLLPDGTHPDAEAYAKWRETLASFLSR